MKVAVVDHGYNLGILKGLFESPELLRTQGLESVGLEPIVVYRREPQRQGAVERTQKLYDNAEQLVVTYEQALERLRALAGDIGMLVVANTLGGDCDGLDLIGDVRRGRLGEQLKDIPTAIIADFGDPLSSHDELAGLRINMFLDYIIFDKVQDALLAYIRKLEQEKS